jgi:hypothetical protein
MLNLIKNFLFPNQSSFVVEEVDHTNRVAILTDHEFSLRIKIPFGEKTVKDVRIIEPYAVRFTYKDGTSEVKRILE